MSTESSGEQVEQEWAPPGIDTTIPHSARMYDWWLGGKDNFASDRQLGEMFVQAIPTIRTMAQENRAFMHRSTRYLVNQGIDQFLDIGTGIPTKPNLHETAQELNPEARVVYVDNDPIVLVHARALMVSDERGRTEYIHADLMEPDKILADGALLNTLDLSRPVGLMLIAVLMLLADEDDPWGKAKTLMDAQGQMTVVPRVRDDVAKFFADWELVDPGVTPVMAWRPEDGEMPENPNAAYYWAGVARKP